jgi:MFS superfamily sulfate permease-like transporter
MQCVASFFFMYFAIIAPTIAFGGLLSETTGNQIGVIESMVGSCAVGVIFALFAGQPLSILGPTGPVVLFEGLVYRIAE